MATAKKAPAKTARGRAQDRARVAATQPHEVAYVAKKTGATKAAVKKAAKKVGPARKAIEKVLKKSGK